MPTTPEHYHFPKTIGTAAVIGTGASGAPAIRHLRDAGITVRAFERQSTTGGIWNWSPEWTPIGVPTPPPSLGAFTPVTSTLDGRVLSKEDKDRFSPPNPVYWSLSNNVPTSTMAFKDYPYPAGTPDTVPHHELAVYLHGYAEHFSLVANISFNTRVENAQKLPTGEWRLTLHKIEPTETFWTEDFDALIVATGHYNAPYMPPLPGASEWARRWPESIIHSSAYRLPQPYASQNILIVGAGTSGVDIARDLVPHASIIYVAAKRLPEAEDAYAALRVRQRGLLPANATVVPEIKQFLHPHSPGDIESGIVQLVDGSTLSNISLVLFATGYQYSYPFLPEHHHDTLPPPAAAKSTQLVTDGKSVHNLYRDTFYIPDPTLCFLGVSVGTAAFSFFEYQSMAVARVLSATAYLPPSSRMWELYDETVEEKGHGRLTHFMGPERERVFVAETVSWLNADAEVTGARGVEGHSDEWILAQERWKESLRVGDEKRAGVTLKTDEVKAEDSEEDNNEDAEESEHAQEQVDISVGPFQNVLGLYPSTLRPQRAH